MYSYYQLVVKKIRCHKSGLKVTKIMTILRNFFEKLFFFTTFVAFFNHFARI